MRHIFLAIIMILPLVNLTADEAKVDTDKHQPAEQQYPWCGKYCMSFFTKTRTAKTVGKDHLSVALKMQFFDWEKKKDSSGDYNSLPGGDKRRKLTSVFTTKYGWAENHHIGIGVPVFFNDFDLGGSSNNSKGIGNVFIFEKWNFLKETNNCPAVSVDFWYYFPTGDPDRQLGSDSGACKVTCEISKAWKDFSLHFNPAYTFKETDNSDIDEVNAGIIFTPTKTLWPAVEYNYYHTEGKGSSHDIVPGIIWKFDKCASFKFGVVINADSSYTYRDRVGFVTKLFYRF